MHPQSTSKRFRLALVISVIVIAFLMLALNDDIRASVTSSPFDIMKAILIVGALCAAAYWKFSSPYFQLRDQILSKTTDGTYGSKKSIISAVLIGILVVLFALALMSAYIVLYQ